MSDFNLLFNGLLLIVILVLLLKPRILRWWRRLRKACRSHLRRRWQPASPHDCQMCCNGVSLSAVKPRDTLPYSHAKSTRGRKKTVVTRGFACPNADCDYFGITDDTHHALVGYGTHNQIQRFKCQCCRKVFSSRIGTPLYYLKTDPHKIEMALWLLAEGVDVSVLVRFTGHADATLARWLKRMGAHSTAWHNRFFRDLILTVIQIDELYTRVRGVASARWLWLAIDPASKAIPSMRVGGRTKPDAFAIVHDLAMRLAPGIVPAFTTDGLRSYFYALTAHFGSWFLPPKARKDHWKPSDDLHYGMLVKHQKSYRTIFALTRMAFGLRAELFKRLEQIGQRRIIQTAFVERVNLTFRQSVAPLSRRTWSYAQSEEHLRLHCEWFRAYYHFVRPHESLRLPVQGLKRRYRSRTPSMALGLTDHIWSVRDLLHYPVPQSI